jgi:hypothetical protein
MEYFVSPTGDDRNPGTECLPFQTIARGLQGASTAQASRLQPGDILTLRGGTYVENVKVEGLAGAPGQEIAVRSYNGERAVLDSRIEPTAGWQWLPAGSVVEQQADPDDPPPHPDEWVSCQAFDRPLEVGAFLQEPYRRLISYSTVRDFRSGNQHFGEIPAHPDPQVGPWVVLDDHGNEQNYSLRWVYMGPGLWYNPVSGCVHIRLTHTTNNVPGIEDYAGPTNPNELELAICDVNTRTLTIVESSHLVFTDLTVRFAGTNTMMIDHCESVTFDRVDVWASTNALRLGSFTGLTFRNCRFDGGLPPWFFRTDRKSQYDYRMGPGEPKKTNKLGKATVDTLMYGQGDMHDLEIDHCEFVNSHDLYLLASKTHFHHNWIDNLNDEAMLLDARPSAGGCIHSNVITHCLTGISMAVNLTADHWYIYRNLIDLRAPTANRRPGNAGDTAVWADGIAFKSNEDSLPDGPYDLFHNTFLVFAPLDQAAAYTHYRSALSPHCRRSFNNIFFVVNPNLVFGKPIAFIPPATFPGPTDGNLFARTGVGNAPAFTAVADTPDNALFFDTLETLWSSQLFEQSKAQYPPGYEANSLLDVPPFRRIGLLRPDVHDDLRLGAGSEAASHAVPLPPDLQELDDAVDPAAGGPSQAIGCYRIDSGPLRVGVHGRRSFPRLVPPP